MTRNERKLKALDQEMQRYSGEIKSIWHKAEEDDRETSPDERGEVEERLKAIETLKEQKTEVEASIKVEKDVDAVSKDLGPASSKGIELGGDGIRGVQVSRVQPVASWGEQFTESSNFKALTEAWKDGRQQFSTGAVQMQTKGTLTESAGSGLGLIPTPQVVPGRVDKLFQRLTVRDLLASGQTNTNSLRYVVEGTATSGAAGVAEGAAKPESTLGLSTVDEPVKKIATVLNASDEMLEDVPAVQAYINERLSLFVSIEEERQLVSGGGTNDLIGITGRSINTYAAGTVDNNAVALFKALNGTRGSSFLEPDAIIINPANWQVTRLLTDTAGQFFGGGPFTSAYAGQQGPVSATGGQLASGDSIWGKPVVVTTAIGAGTALLGSFRTAAQVFSRGGVSVEATNSHSDYFTKNLVAIRAEERLALAVYRPVAFTQVTGLD